MIDSSTLAPLATLRTLGGSDPSKRRRLRHCPEMDEEMDDAPPTMGWECLPFELHRKVLQILAHDEVDSKLVAEYAVVCKSWQAQIEEVNFSRLVIRPSDVHNLEQFVIGSRRAYLKHLWLKVELSKYPTKLRLVPEDENEQETNNFDFTMALFHLFEVLESWDKPSFWEERNGRGLNLELSAHSPSDKKTLFGEAGLGPDGGSRFFDSLLDFYLLAINDPQGIHGLPMVNVVTGFWILRRNHRNVSATALTPILRSLPRLEEVRFEPWEQVDQAAQEDVDSGKCESTFSSKSQAVLRCSPANKTLSPPQNSPASCHTGQPTSNGSAFLNISVFSINRSTPRRFRSGTVSSATSSAASASISKS